MKQLIAKVTRIVAIFTAIFAAALSTTLALVSSANANSRAVEVRLDESVLHGEASGSVLTFKGIPYAASPAGQNRWKPPQPVTYAGDIDASRYGAQCPQRTDQITSEDCLFINVFTSAIADSSAAIEPKPVLVWIHGGGYVGGSGNLDMRAVSHWLSHDVVVVSFNYRLGVLGIFAHPVLDASMGANFSVLDMVAALKWVKSHISLFGGDPNNVTIAGGSAGGMAIQMLMVAPQSESLFHRAISQSGYGAWPLPRTNKLQPLPQSLNAHEYAQVLVSKVISKAASSVTAEDLTNVSASQWVEAIEGFHLPVADGVILPDEPGVVFMQGRQHDVPYMSGGNSYDGSVYPWSGVPAARLIELAGDEAPGIKGVYQLPALPDGNGYQLLPYQHLFGDMRYVLAGSVTTEAMLNKVSQGYRYFFDVTRNGEPGAHHGAEVNALFYPSSLPGVLHMQRYWLHFIKYGNPNAANLPEWKAVDTNGENWMVFTASGATQVPHIRGDKLQSLDRAYKARVHPLIN
ncbi:carboxylesterase family protein [Aestuariibacter sp. GS-14]|uniref:carboxylesterase family protein n=1 Tax=Aestuariibacter sp. GS-14 TaxID=2590670 RepID=UPI00112B9152|nr:carboxylesterase family protein [Aestuariibacter sp. GS-14]TPV58983.1 carboxylesterase family protein [Aestuariibacter sp. GS-14]